MSSTNNPTTTYNNRILVADDNASIHQDFVKILGAENDAVDDELDRLLGDVFAGDADSAAAVPVPDVPRYDIDHAYQGRQAFEKAVEADADGKPFALIFMDVRMPPGWDGIETIRRIWEKAPHTEVAICTAYSDYSWEGILQELGSNDQLQFLRKPFDVVSIRQMALSLTKKWNLARKSRQYMSDLEREVAERTRELRAKVDEISKLRGILPMCAYCHKIRDDDNYWQQVDDYIRGHSLAEISHGICPDCYEKVMGEINRMDPKAPLAADTDLAAEG